MYIQKKAISLGLQQIWTTVNNNGETGYRIIARAERVIKLPARRGKNKCSYNFENLKI